MDNNKELIAVFGDPEKLYMAGDITEAWGHQNVIGFWKAIIGNEDLEGEEFEDGTIELYVRETTGQERRYRYIFDEEVFSGEKSSGKIDYNYTELNSTDVSSANYEYEYFAAIMRVDETNYQVDKERLIFIYSDEDNIDVLILEESNDNYDIYESIIPLYDSNRESFREEIKLTINDFKEDEDADYLTGNSLDFNNPFETE